MAEIAKSGVPSLATTSPAPDTMLSAQVAGEALGAYDACYLNADGKWYKATGAAANAAAKVRGFAAAAYAAGDTNVTLRWHVRVRYGAALTPGTSYYLSGTVAGGLADAASTGGTNPIAFAVSDTRIEISRNM